MENGILSRVDGLFEPQAHGKPILGILISHAHPDHFGLLDYANTSIPIYMSRESKAMIETCNIFYPKEMRVSNAMSRCHTFEQWQPFHLEEFRITPHLIDHSAFGASSFLIEAKGKRILYSGDLRAHGRKGNTFESLTSSIGQIDCMLLEGTTLGGKHHIGFGSEEEVELALVKALSDSNLTCVQATGSNIDRMVSVYRACKRRRKTMVIDLYQYCLLLQAKRFAPSLPPHQGDILRVFFEKNQSAKMRSHGWDDILETAFPIKISPSEMIRKAPNVVLRLSWRFMEKIVERLDDKDGISFIYSMWKGYLEKGDSGREMAEMPKKHCGRWQHIHTSGHAWLDDLKSLTRGISPRKLVPIHTLEGDSFADHFANVVRIKDGGILKI